MLCAFPKGPPGGTESPSRQAVRVGRGPENGPRSYLGENEGCADSGVGEKVDSEDEEVHKMESHTIIDVPLRVRSRYLERDRHDGRIDPIRAPLVYESHESTS